MTPFEEWWETTAYTGLDGPTPRIAAQQGGMLLVFTQSILQLKN